MNLFNSKTLIKINFYNSYYLLIFAYLAIAFVPNSVLCYEKRSRSIIVAANGKIKTISAALKKAKAGDVILVKNGTYQEEIKISLSNIQLKAYPGHLPKIDGGGKLRRGFYNQPGVSIENVQISGFEVYGQIDFGFYFNDAPKKIEIQKNKIHHILHSGITIRSGSYCKVTNNEIYLIGNHIEAMGIHFLDCFESEISHNLICLVKKNGIRDSGLAGHNNKIFANSVSYCYSGISINLVSGAEVYNNLLYSNVYGMVPKHLNDKYGSSKIFQNTFRYNLHNNIHVGVNRRRVFDKNKPDLEGLSIKNNVFYPTQSAYIRMQEKIIAKVQLDKNIYIYDGISKALIFSGKGQNAHIKLLKELRKSRQYELNGKIESVSKFKSSQTKAGAKSAKLRQSVIHKILRLIPKDASVNSALLKNTCDMNRDTKWNSGDSAKPQWLLWKIPKNKLFQYILLIPSGHKAESNAKDIQFDISNDGKNFHRLKKTSNNYSGSPFIYEFSMPVKAKFLRLQLITNHSPDIYKYTKNQFLLDDIVVLEAAQTTKDFLEPSKLPLTSVKKIILEQAKLRPVNKMPTQNLVSYWDFEGSSPYFIEDRTGKTRGFNFMAKRVKGLFGHALKFSRFDLSYIDFGHSKSLDSTQQLTVSVWLKPKNVSDASMIVLSHGNNRKAGWYWWFDPIRGWSVWLNKPKEFQQVNTGYFPEDGKWTYLVMVLDKTKREISLYLNGRILKKEALKFDIASPKASFMLGSYNYRFLFSWQGEVDDLAVYSRKLSQHEIQEIYKKASGKALSR
jgi:Concanavalin A-like lectin/glucanases superfamily/F5/8 type C domain/Periplasmic copper-binding protein (NosD)